MTLLPPVRRNVVRIEQEVVLQGFDHVRVHGVLDHVIEVLPKLTAFSTKHRGFLPKLGNFAHKSCGGCVSFGADPRFGVKRHLIDGFGCVRYRGQNVAGWPTWTWNAFQLLDFFESLLNNLQAFLYNSVCLAILILLCAG